jgi:hypothetical protein
MAPEPEPGFFSFFPFFMPQAPVMRTIAKFITSPP